MKFSPILIICALVAATAACSRMKPEDLYHYRPVSMNEVPASIDRYTPIYGGSKGWIVDETNTRIFNARIAAVNGVPLYDPAYQADIFPDGSREVVHLNPGPAKVRVFLEGKAMGFFSGNIGAKSFQDLTFNAQPGERYRVVGAGEDTHFSIWVEDSRGNKGPVRQLMIEMRYEGTTPQPTGTKDAIIKGLIY